MTGLIPDVGCFIHTLQLCINDSLFSQRSITDILAKVRTVCKHFGHSVVAKEKFKEIQAELGIKVNALIQDIKTRWNSTYYMLERYNEQKSVS